MSKILTLGVLEAEKLQKPKWPKYCETPCMQPNTVPISLQGLVLNMISDFFEGLVYYHIESIIV